MKKTLLLNVVLTACLIGGAVSTRAEDDKSASKPDKAQQSAAQKTNAPARPTNQNDSAAKPKSGKGEKADSKGKVSINHKGQVISVNEHAVKGHLAHGDTIVSDNASSTPNGKSKEGGKSKDKSK